MLLVWHFKVVADARPFNLSISDKTKACDEELRPEPPPFVPVSGSIVLLVVASLNVQFCKGKATVSYYTARCRATRNTVIS